MSLFYGISEIKRNIYFLSSENIIFFMLYLNLVDYCDAGDKLLVEHVSKSSSINGVEGIVPMHPFTRSSHGGWWSTPAVNSQEKYDLELAQILLQATFRSEHFLLGGSDMCTTYSEGSFW